MVRLFKNFFVCNGIDLERERELEKFTRLYNELKDEVKDIKDEVKILKRDINTLFRDNTNIRTDIKNLELKLDSRFDVLTGKLDSLILLLKKN